MRRTNNTVGLSVSVNIERAHIRRPTQRRDERTGVTCPCDGGSKMS